ncbi:MAG: response regulator [Bdellovibrionales bacterium]|nr:response regulator [Bdellovibrionales bacterium]
MKTLRILLVDDSPSIITLVRSFIEDEFDAEVFEATDGESAEQLLQEQNALMEPIDIVFLDWMMPKLSGYGLLKRIRGTGGFFKQPAVVMLTAETYFDQIEACMKYRVSKYITKPFSQEDVKTAIVEVLEELGAKRAV